MYGKTFFILSLLSLPLFSQIHWSSWHGGESQGKYDSKLCSNWSENTNIRWKTLLTGEGHSSPITDGKTLYLTTGFKDQNAEKWLNIAFNLIFILFLFFLYNSIQGILQLQFTQSAAGLKILYALISIITFLVFIYGEALFDFQRCSIRRWIVTSTLLTLLLVSNIIMAKKPHVKKIISYLLIILGLIVIIFVPSKSHAYRHGVMGTSSLVMYGIGGLPIMIGLLYWVSHFSTHSKSFLKKYWKWGIAITGILFTVWAVSFIFKVSIENHSITSELNTAPYTPILSAYITLALFIFAAGVHFIKKKYHQTWPSILCTVLNSMVILGLFIHIAEGLAIIFPYFSYQFGSPIVETRFTSYYIIISLLVIIIAIFFNKPISPKIFQPLHFTVTILFGLFYFLLINFGLQGKLYNYAILAFDAETGKSKWQQTIFQAPRFPVHKDNSIATPTPACDNQQVFAYFGSVGLACVDTSGRLLWTNSSIPHNTIYGPASSPILHDNRLFICTTLKDSVIVYAIEQENGTIIWKRQGPYLRGSSGLNRAPIIVSHTSHESLLVWGSDSLASYDPCNGSLLWQIKVPVRQMDHVTSILKDEKHIYCIGLDRTIAFFKDSLGISTNSIAWSTKIRGCNVPSGIVGNQHIIFLTDHGQLVLLDKNSGEPIYKKKLKGLFYASPIATARHIYCMNTNGTCYVLNNSDSLSTDSVNTLDDNVFATPLPLQEKLIIRSKNTLFCISN